MVVCLSAVYYELSLFIRAEYKSFLCLHRLNFSVSAQHYFLKLLSRGKSFSSRSLQFVFLYSIRGDGIVYDRAKPTACAFRQIHVGVFTKINVL